MLRRLNNILGVLLIVMLAGAGVLVPTQEVWADPHAVYYTARAQQQLFFNVLAALNQADFVELADREATTLRPIDRAGLLERRDREGTTGIEDFPPAVREFITSTETDLSSLVTRPITLEGYDLYTDYLIRQLAGEKQRIQSGEQLGGVFCERIFGRPGCKDAADADKPSPADKAAQERAVDKAYIDKPLKWAAWAIQFGLAAVLFPEDYEPYRTDLVEGKFEGSQNAQLDADGKPIPGTEPKKVKPNPRPVAYDGAYAAVKKQTATNAPAAGGLLDYMASSILNDSGGTVNWGVGGADSVPLAHLREVGTGENKRLVAQPPANRTMDNVIQQADANWRLFSDMRRLAEAGAGRVAAQQELIQVDGIKSDVIAEAHKLGGQAPPQNNGTGPSLNSPPRKYGEVSLTLTKPAPLKREQLANAAALPHDIDIAQQFANPRALESYGTAELTHEGAGEVAGTRTDDTNPQTSGRVLHAATAASLAGHNLATLTYFGKPAHAQGLYGALLRLMLPEENLQDEATLLVNEEECTGTTCPCQGGFGPPGQCQQQPPGGPGGPGGVGSLPGLNPLNP